MRTILILLLVGSLLWLVLHGFRSVRAGQTSAAEPTGLLMPVESKPAAPATDAPAPAPPFGTASQAGTVSQAATANKSGTPVVTAQKEKAAAPTPAEQRLST
jgi:hypothetical protein